MGIQVWDGNYYALAVTERLGVEAEGGMVHVGLVHYNTEEEIGSPAPGPATAGSEILIRNPQSAASGPSTRPHWSG